MTIRSARRRKVLALPVPVLVSTALLLMLAAALPAPAGTAVLLVGAAGSGRAHLDRRTGGAGTLAALVDGPACRGA